MADTAPESADNTSLGKLSELAWKAIPAIGSAVGFVGFVAVIGAALLWLRFDIVGLPATQALLAVPRQELVIVGAWELATAVLGGLVAALVVYLFDSKGDATVSTARGIVVVATVEAYTALFVVHLNCLDTILFLIGVTGVGFIGGFVFGAFTPHFTRRRKVRRLRDEALLARNEVVQATDIVLAAGSVRNRTDETNAAIGNGRLGLATAQRRWRRVLAEWEAAISTMAWQRKKADVDSRRERVTKVAQSDPPPNELELRPRMEDTELRMGGWLTALAERSRKLRKRLAFRFEVAVALAAIALLVGAVFVLAHAGGYWIAILLAVAAALAVTNLFIAHGTEKFLWYGVSVFFSVVVFGSVLQIAQTIHRPEIQPVALLRKGNDTGLCGVFVTQTSDRVYIGRLPYPSYRPGLIFWVPTSEVDIVSVGHLESIGPNLPLHQTQMLGRLYMDRTEEPPPSLKNETKTVVKGAEGGAGKETTETTEAPGKKYRSSPHAGAPRPSSCDPRPDPIDPPKGELSHWPLGRDSD
jgi:hypothetical protein